MKTGKIITELGDKKDSSQADLAKESNMSRVMIGKYERDEALPSIDVAKKQPMRPRYRSITLWAKDC